ncbi:probable pectinesterase/pectinesterase inhibitor 51 [Coffea eugenioides]|uniref:probable pectinesterase/pectinesterase inhibitor 51 n=1 Tax=Coffea eugenioides TaxID=49369 RepID=UPI000F60DF81|nr:probable pectinesterase/pectinesterase inhibitor 51 [Coffea eugenioides]
MLPMTSFISCTFLSFLLFFSISSAKTTTSFLQPPPPPSSPSSSSPENDLIHEACKASRDPPTCESTLSQSSHVPPPNSTLLDVIQSATWASSENLNLAILMVNDILNSSAENLNLSIAAWNCVEGLVYSAYRTGSTAENLPRGRMKDSRAWMSAALAYQAGCSSGLKTANGGFNSKVNETVAFLDGLIGITTNSLGMMVNYDNFGNESGSWGPPKTERDGFWDRVNGSSDGVGSGFDFNGGVPSGLKAIVTVCKGGGCDYETVQEAVNVAPDNDASRRFVIWIKAGLYEETVRVPLEKKNVVFLGDGMGKTVIAGSLNVGMPRVSTYNTATVGVIGDGFMASGVTFHNTAGPVEHQAVAFRSQSDLSVIENCEFISNQDTLYAHSLRQYYKSCRIQGNVDFIFGNAAAFFQDCIILVAPRQIKPEKGETNAVTAQSRTSPAQSTGFVFHNCVINGTEEYMALYYSNPSVHRNFLGRPWREYSRTVYINSTIEALISPEGWLPWNGDYALATLYYGEYANSGPGANVTGRVSWSSRIPDEHVQAYSVHNFIQGDGWIPASS